MAKEKEKQLARLYYVQQGKTAKEVAELVGVTEKTLGNWVSQFGWKSERDTLMFSAQNNINTIKLIINDLAEDRIRLSNELKKTEDKEVQAVLRKQMAALADEASKWNKKLQNVDKESKIGLEVWLTVTEDVFKNIQASHPDIYMKLIDFQEQYINLKAVQLG